MPQKPWEQYKFAGQTPTQATELPHAKTGGKGSSFWDTTFGELIGPTVDAWNPINIAKGALEVGGTLMGAVPDMLKSAILGGGPTGGAFSFSQTPSGQRLGQMASDMVTEPVVRGYNKAMDGNLAGAMGEVLALGSQMVGPKNFSKAGSAVANKTPIGSIPAKVAQSGVRPGSNIEKMFPDTNIGQAIIDHRVTNADQARAKSTALTPQIESIMSQITERVPVVDHAQDIFSRTGLEADVFNLGAHGQGELDRLVGLEKNYQNFYGPNSSRSMMDLYNEKKAVANMDNWTKDARGDINATNVDTVWKHNTARAAKDKMVAGAERAGLDDPGAMLKDQQDLMGVQTAFNAVAPGSRYLQHILGMSAGSALGGYSGGLPGAIAGAGIVGALSSPGFMAGTGIALDAVGTFANHPGTIGAYGVLGQQGRGADDLARQILEAIRGVRF